MSKKKIGLLLLLAGLVGLFLVFTKTGSESSDSAVEPMALAEQPIILRPPDGLHQTTADTRCVDISGFKQQSILRTYETNLEPDPVASAYRTSMAREGWNLVRNEHQSGTVDVPNRAAVPGQMLAFSQPDHSLLLEVYVSKANEGTTIVDVALSQAQLSGHC